MEPDRSKYSEVSEKVISPFAQNSVTISPNRGSSGKLFLIIGISLVLLVVGVAAGMAIMHYLNDPYRTLESFSVSKYLDNYQGMAGSKYKAVLQVEADLGWKDGAGRLMLFSTKDDSRPIAILVPSAVAKNIYFTKGQSYIAEIEVKEGGLIYANSCQKD